LHDDILRSSGQVSRFDAFEIHVSIPVHRPRIVAFNEAVGVPNSSFRSLHRDMLGELVLIGTKSFQGNAVSCRVHARLLIFHFYYQKGRRSTAFRHSMGVILLEIESQRSSEECCTELSRSRSSKVTVPRFGFGSLREFGL